MSAHRLPHPVVYTVLYLPFGMLGGFVGVALTFLATRSGLSVTEGAFLGAASLMMNWLKWSWAPVVDTTLSPKAWYRISTALSGLGVAAMAAIPLGPATLPWLLAVIALASLVNSIVGMAVEALMAHVTPVEERGRVSAWFQAGNLGGNGVGGGLGLWLLQILPQPWMAGALFGAAFLLCNLALRALPDIGSEPSPGGLGGAFRGVWKDVREMAATQGGLLSAILCFLPIGTGAASGVLTQASVAAAWGAGDTEVALLQGVVAGIVTAIGCFGGGWLCQRFAPRTAYAAIGLGLALVALGMAASPSTVAMYVVWNMLYSFVVGLAFAAFTAVVLDAIGKGSAATKYNLYATLSNFPIWWVGLVLARSADAYGARTMLMVEAALGVAGVAIFLVSTRAVRRTQLALG